MRIAARMRHWGAVLVGLALATAAIPAQARQAETQTSPADAFQSGVAAHQKGDFASARALFQRACDSGNAEGCFSLGSFLVKGEGGAFDLPGARTAFQRACDGGHTRGCTARSLLGQ